MKRDIGEALKGAQQTRYYKLDGTKFVQIWYGGSVIVEYNTDTGQPHTWKDGYVFEL